MGGVPKGCRPDRFGGSCGAAILLACDEPVCCLRFRVYTKPFCCACALCAVPPSLLCGCRAAPFLFACCCLLSCVSLLCVGLAAAGDCVWAEAGNMLAALGWFFVCICPIPLVLCVYM
jgi:hypothetical protein